jgi:exosortase C (VPDSG-CTERM-specific)
LSPAATAAIRSRAPGLGLFAVVLIACFALPLYDLVRLALRSNIYSHVLLIPFISGYLLWLKRGELAWESPPARWLASIPAVMGLSLLAGYWIAVGGGWQPGRDNYLALMTLAFLCLLLGGMAWFMGAETLRRGAFPLGFLVFMAPFPTAVLDGIEAFLQHGSADAAQALLVISGMPLLRDDTIFRLPGFTMEVAPQCSGIRSTLVLFITSTVAAYLFLRSPWRRAVFILAVMPLALLRNGLRIFTIGQLCVQVSPDMIHSFIHTNGGPIFFALSLIPFFLLLLWLRKSENKKRSPGPEPTTTG